MKITFLGATEEVTGSCYLVEAAGSRILLECGLIQGMPADTERNREPFQFEVSSIDAMILSHAHIDHSGRIPLLVKSGYTGPIYTHKASLDLCTIMLRDSGYLHEKDAEWENRKRQRKGLKLIEPIYTARQAEASIQNFEAIDYDEPITICPNIELCLYDAGHILGSAIVSLTVNEHGSKKRLVFSGDLGQSSIPILRDPTVVKNADVVLMESTYGDRCHRSKESTHQEITDVFTEANAEQGKILIPSFAVGRTQELLYLFAKNREEWGIDRWNIFLDSPLAISATEVYEKHHRVYDREAAKFYGKNGFKDLLPNLKYTHTAEESMQLNRIDNGAIIIAGSGMCTGGRIKHHLKHNLWRNRTHIMIVGFQARGTPGRALVDGAKYIRLWGETIRVAAKIHTIGGLSAHADQKGLLNWLSHFEGDPDVYLVHGEERALQAMQDAVKNQLQFSVQIAKRAQQVDI